MNHKTLSLSLAVLAVATAGWDAHADPGYRRSLQPQHHRYDPGSRHPERFDHHGRGVDCSRYSESRCEQACAYGRNFGQAMAQSLSAPTGMHDGFLVGFRRAKASGLADGSGKYIDVTEGQSSVHLPGGFIQRLIEDQLEELRAQAAEEGRKRGHDDAVRRFEAILNTDHPLNDRLDAGALTTDYAGEWDVAERLISRPGLQDIVEVETMISRHRRPLFQRLV